MAPGASVSQDLVSVDCFRASPSAFTAGAVTQLQLPLLVLVCFGIVSTVVGLIQLHYEEGRALSLP
jgi:hypothetical protein